MASSSAHICFQCSHTPTNLNQFRGGWRLRSGDHAQLCLRCGSVYEEGKFCETFHSTDPGWRDCESCGKLVHCGCVVSFNSYLLLDFGGIICMECSRQNFTMARARWLSLEAPSQILNSQRDHSNQVHIEFQYCPRVTDFELQQIERVQNSSLTPLFEKLLSASDADPELACLVIPNSCAVAFFPSINNPHGFPISILDTDVKEWDFFYRYFPSGGSRTHVLEGIRDYMILKNWQTGDTVTFFRVEPFGKLMMGLRKAYAATGSRDSP